MKHLNFRQHLTLVLVTVFLAAACAKQKNDSPTRVAHQNREQIHVPTAAEQAAASARGAATNDGSTQSSGTGVVDPQLTSQAKTAVDSANATNAAAVATTSAAAQGKADAATADPKTKDISATKTEVGAEEVNTEELCRLVPVEQLSKDAQKDTHEKQSFCDAIEVKSDSDGKINFKQLVDLKQMDTYYQFKDDEITTSNDNTTLILMHESKKSDDAKAKDELFLSYYLNGKKSEMNTSSIKVLVNDTELSLTKKQFDILRNKDTDEVFIRILDLDVLSNINFKIQISYKSNPAVST